MNFKYRTLFENAIEGIFQTTPEGKCITANPALARMHGYDSAEDFVTTFSGADRSLKEIYVNPEDRSRWTRLCDEKGSMEGFESQVYRKDKGKIWVTMNARAVKDERGNTVRYDGTMVDITRRKEVEAAQSEERYRSYRLNVRRRFLKMTSCDMYCQPTLEKFFQKEESEIIGRRDSELRTKEAATKARKADLLGR